MNPMNPFVKEIGGSFLRHVFTAGAGWLVVQGYLQPDAAERYVEATVLFLLSVGWAVWQKYQARQKLVTAMALPSPSTEHEVELAVKAGSAPPVSVPKSTQAVLEPPKP